MGGQCSLHIGIHRMVRIHIQHHGFHATLFLIKGLTSTAKEVKQWNPLIFLMFLNSLRWLSFIEWLNGLLKTQILLQLGDNALQSWESISSRGYRTVALPYQVHSSHAQGVKKEWDFSPWYQRPTCNVFIYCSHTLCSVGLVIVFQGRNASAGRHSGDSTELEVKTALDYAINLMS